MAPALLPDLDQPGPHPSFIQVAKPYVFEHKVQECMTAIGVTEAKEDNIRLQGIAWIDSVRKAMQLYARSESSIMLCKALIEVGLYGLTILPRSTIISFAWSIQIMSTIFW